jgi:phosphate starvation-inducible PhoH-like protein
MAKKEQPTYQREERQPSKIKFKPIKLSKRQKEFSDTILKNKITIGTGSPGTSKTFTACFTAMNLFNSSLIDKIIITKPIETIGSSLGFLKGTLDEKIEVYKECFIQNFSEMIDGESLKSLMNGNKIIFKPVQYMRGITIKNCLVIIDEVQNFDLKEIMAIVTRMGENCKMVFIGDVHQNDIDKKYVGLNIFKEILSNIKDVGIFEFERSDIVRDPILIEITDRYEQFKLDGKISLNKKNT